MRYIKVFLLVLVFFVVMMFFVQNQASFSDPVTLRLDVLFLPSMESMPIPLYAIMLACFAVGAVLVLLMLIWDRIVVMGRLSASHRKITALEKKLAVATDAQVRLEKERTEVETKLQQQLEDAEQRVNTALRAAGGQRVGFDSGE